MSDFVPLYLENLTKVNTMPSPMPFNIALDKKQIDWIFRKSWLKLLHTPDEREQGKPPWFAWGVACILWDGNSGEGKVVDGDALTKLVYADTDGLVRRMKND